MITQLRRLLERAEFDAIEVAVRYYEAIASVEELARVLARLEGLRAVGASLEQKERELSVFPRYPDPPPGLPAGH